MGNTVLPPPGAPLCGPSSGLARVDAHRRAVILRAVMSRAVDLLVLEDRPEDAELLLATLRRAGFAPNVPRADTRESFGAALEGSYDAIFADFQLPAFNALEALEMLAEAGVRTPVIVVTGAVGEEVAVECMKRGATDYLLKDRLTRLPQALEHALEQDRLQRVAEESAEHLRLAHEETIRRLAMAVDSRSTETGAHIERMGALTAQIAEALEIEDEVLAVIGLAASMHDVGKIGIPDTILQKPGPLTPAERREMERHTEVGHAILSGSRSELLTLAAEIALTHHERWDGGGYPAGLAGEEIPLAGRIAAVADVYDALTSPRVYRPAMTEERAMELMRAGRGTHFDPAVLDAFETVRAARETVGAS
jgi:putative two-component system response regulator